MLTFVKLQETSTKSTGWNRCRNLLLVGPARWPTFPASCKLGAKDWASCREKPMRQEFVMFHLLTMHFWGHIPEPLPFDLLVCQEKLPCQFCMNDKRKDQKDTSTEVREAPNHPQTSKKDQDVPKTSKNHPKFPNHPQLYSIFIPNSCPRTWRSTPISSANFSVPCLARATALRTWTPRLM